MATHDTTNRPLTREDSLRLAGSKIDTTKRNLGRLVSPVLTAGSITERPSYTITDSEITWNDYTFSGEVLDGISGTYLANMYQPGNPSQLYFDGLGSDFTKYTLDGIELNDPSMPSMNLYQIPMEFVRNVEYVDALRAPIYQFNANGSLVNLQTQSYSEAVPYSKVRFLQEPYNYLITDGVFSQNIGFKSNIDAGFERQTTDGRFDNSVYDGVNIRAKYRYSIDSVSQITASELYYRTKGGTNGGSLPYNVNASIFDQFQPPRSETANLTTLQHHVQLAYSEVDPSDSSEFYTLSIFFGYHNFQFGETDSSFYLANVSKTFGGDLRGSKSLPGSQLNFGLEAVRVENTFNSLAVIPSTDRYSAYADDEVHFFNLMKAGIFGRGDFVGKNFYPAFGASFGFGNGIFDLEAGGNLSRHVPSSSEKYFVTTDFAGNHNLKAETDKTLQITANFNFSNALCIMVKPFMKFATDPIYFQTKYSGEPIYPEISVLNLSDRKIYGVDASLRVSLWKLEGIGKLNYIREEVDGAEVSILPKIFASGEVYFHDVWFENHLNLKVGFRGQFESAFMGEEFYPEGLIYYPGTLNIFGPFGSSDFFVQGKIGDAVIYLTIRNIVGQDYVLAPVYPALNSSFALGINWEFLN